MEASFGGTKWSLLRTGKLGLKFKLYQIKAFSANKIPFIYICKVIRSTV